MNAKYWILFSIIFSCNNGWTTVSDEIGRIVKEFRSSGSVRAKEPLNWKLTPDDVRAMNSLDTKYYKIKYPKCLKPEDVSEEDNVQISPHITFNRTEKCPGYKGEWVDLLAVYWTREHYEKAKTADDLTLGNAIYDQIGTVNGYPAAYSIILDSIVRDMKIGYEVQLSYIVLILCKGDVYAISASALQGKQSLDLIKSEKFDFPEDFKKIASSFECKGIPDSMKVLKKTGKK
ncbi:hypothetical protein QJS83_13000 [Bdellovibrio sp. 22V]|uniref:hypothetical protein n=1 Tax=Bdellovibrio sp. 22V TaxID=3044166 RepID=UPI002543BB56|nr:hypothetical protein [Bdellovibrio sp. 22V]WII71380.1 hypothetical protein QJS83_13000 [Bdellovibrio sp. 22V]